MGFREELADEGYPSEAISRAIEEVRARIESEKVPPDFDGIKKALSRELAPTEVTYIHSFTPISSMLHFSLVPGSSSEP